MSGGIYIISRKDGSRCYIGSAINIARRWATHRCRLRKGNHHSPQLQAAWNKHGPDAFDFAVLEEVSDPSMLISREQEWLDKVNPHYNTAKVAGSVLGHTVSAEARAKISAAHRGRKNGPPSADTRAKISIANSGRPLTPEHRSKLALAKLGKTRGPYSEAHKARISAGNIAAWAKRKAVTA